MPRCCVRRLLRALGVRRHTMSSSSRWGEKRDTFYRAAKVAGFRARSAYKLLALDARHGLLRPAAGLPVRAVVDLCAAPGSWSQALAAALPAGARIVAVDLQAIAPIAGVAVVQGDITAPATLAAVAAACGGAPVTWSSVTARRT